MIFEFKFPDVGEGVHEGNLLQIKVPIGETVKAGDILAVVETDKVTAEIPSPKDGKIVRYGFEEGQVIEVGQVLAYIQLEGHEANEVAADVPAKKVVEENANVVGELDLGDGSVLPSSGEGLSDSSHENASLTDDSRARKVLATPLARKLCLDHQVDISKITGTGPAGRVTKADIEKYLNGKKEVVEQRADAREIAVEKVVSSSATVQVASDHVVPLSKLRQTIARNMTLSSQIPTATVHEEILMDEIVKFRQSLNAERSGDDRLSYLPFIVKAITIALKRYPAFNATFDQDKQEVTIHGSINLGVAMDNGQGLFVPVIRQAESKSILSLSNEVKNYMAKVKNNSITINEMRGGSFTISNYGSSGGLFANPLILPPQVAILGLGRIQQKPVVKNDSIVIGNVLPVSLVIDHRVLDGAPAGKFLTMIRQLLENPAQLLVEMV